MVGFWHNFRPWDRVDSRDSTRVQPAPKTKANFDMFFQKPSLSLRRRFDAIFRRVKVNARRRKRTKQYNRNMQEVLASENSSSEIASKNHTRKLKDNPRLKLTVVIILVIVLLIMIINVY